MTPPPVFSANGGFIYSRYFMRTFEINDAMRLKQVVG